MSRQVAILLLLSCVAFGNLVAVPALCGDRCTRSRPEGRSDEFVDVDEMPVATSTVAPVRPEAARRAGVSGTLFVRAHVDAGGHVDEVVKEKVLPARIRGRADDRALAELDAAALGAVMGWSFRPARADGRSVPAWITVPVTFDPEDGTDAAPATGTEPGPDVMPRVLTQVEPVYPKDALRRGVKGTVVVQAFVGTNGRVRSAKVATSVPELDRAALDAVKRWTFRPAQSQGRPVEAWLSVPVRFPQDCHRKPAGAPRIRLGGPRMLSGGEAGPLS